MFVFRCTSVLASKQICTMPIGGWDPELDNYYFMSLIELIPPQLSIGFYTADTDCLGLNWGIINELYVLLCLSLYESPGVYLTTHEL